MVPTGIPTHVYLYKLLPNYRLACQIWNQSKLITNFIDMVADMPLWHNPRLSQLNPIIDGHVWERYGSAGYICIYIDILTIFLYPLTRL